MHLRQALCMASLQQLECTGLCVWFFWRVLNSALCSVLCCVLKCLLKHGSIICGRWGLTKAITKSQFVVGTLVVCGLSSATCCCCWLVITVFLAAALTEGGRCLPPPL
jgi:hypothetical protein